MIIIMVRKCIPKSYLFESFDCIILDLFEEHIVLLSITKMLVIFSVWNCAMNEKSLLRKQY